MDFDNFQKASINALVRLADTREKSTGVHIERTSSLCKLLTKLICEKEIYKDKVDQDYIDNLCLVSPLHDIGKIGIPDAILLKPGKLTEEEFEIMKTHVDIGLTVLVNLREMIPKNGILKLAIEVIKYHHEKWDGSGYPYGLKETEIPLPGRIMAIVDVYEALRSKRVYKEPYSHEKSCNIIIEERGKHFDPELVDIFIEKHEDFAATYDKKEHYDSYIA
ncbi:MAG: HD domain-containing protein [Fastidiosipila sp.]|nr:HD domain-containing protein [Fastidiosipila sp.]